jgi:hypothetical protein
MADEWRRITTDSFNPVTIETLQNYGLINSQSAIIKYRVSKLQNLYFFRLLPVKFSP